MHLRDASKNEVPGLRTIHKFIDEGMGAKYFGVQMVEYESEISTTKVHFHEKRESAYIILEGEGTMKLNGIDYELGPGMVVYLSPSDLHGIVGTGSDGLTMIEVWSPLGTDRLDVE